VEVGLFEVHAVYGRLGLEETAVKRHDLRPGAIGERRLADELPDLRESAPEGIVIERLPPEPFPPQHAVVDGLEFQGHGPPQGGAQGLGDRLRIRARIHEGR